MNCAREKTRGQHDVLDGIMDGLRITDGITEGLFLLLFGFYIYKSYKIYLCMAKFILLINGGKKNNDSIYEVRTTVDSLEEVVNSISTSRPAEKKHSSGLRY